MSRLIGTPPKTVPEWLKIFAEDNDQVADHALWPWNRARYRGRAAAFRESRRLVEQAWPETRGLVSPEQRKSGPRLRGGQKNRTEAEQEWTAKDDARLGSSYGPGLRIFKIREPITLSPTSDCWVLWDGKEWSLLAYNPPETGFPSADAAGRSSSRENDQRGRGLSHSREEEA